MKFVAATCIFIASKSTGDGTRKIGDVVTVLYYLTRPNHPILKIGEVKPNFYLFYYQSFTL